MEKGEIREILQQARFRSVVEPHCLQERTDGVSSGRPEFRNVFGNEDDGNEDDGKYLPT